MPRVMTSSELPAALVHGPLPAPKWMKHSCSTDRSFATRKQKRATVITTASWPGMTQVFRRLQMSLVRYALTTQFWWTVGSFAVNIRDRGGELALENSESDATKKTLIVQSGHGRLDYYRTQLPLRSLKVLAFVEGQSAGSRFLFRLTEENFRR